MQEVKIFSESTPIPKQRSKLLSDPKNEQNIPNFVFNAWTVKARRLLKENEKLTLFGGFKDGQTALQIVRHSQGNIDALRSRFDNVCPCFTCHGIIFTRKSY